MLGLIIRRTVVQQKFGRSKLTVSAPCEFRTTSGGPNSVEDGNSFLHMHSSFSIKVFLQFITHSNNMKEPEQNRKVIYLLETYLANAQV